MPGNGQNGGGGGAGTTTNGHWSLTGEGERQWIPGPGDVGPGGFGILGKKAGAGAEEPAPHVPVIREARNVQRANIDRSSLYDPTQTTQALGRDYLQQRNASNPQPLGSTGAGAVGYDFTPSEERLY